jgi:mycothiol system anti-sigma-R factor
MSCGNAHEIPCTEIMTAMLLMIDNEKSAIEQALIIHHLEECPPCQKEHDVSAIVKSLVARSCGSDAAPEAFHAKVWTQITQIQVEITRGFNE